MVMKVVVTAGALFPLILAQLPFLARGTSFVPANRLAGIGLDRPEMSDVLLQRRTHLMIESQTFAILRDPRSLEGAQRVTSPKLQKIFDSASRSSGLPSSFIAAIAYLESWGLANAESSAGPKGIMQFAAATARSAGLRMVYKTRYRTVSVKRKVKGRKGKLVTKTSKRRVPYTVLVRDERMIPEKAVPAAANYLARLEEKYGGRDWAVFAYHCGEGCTTSVRSIVEKSEGIKPPVSVARAFFSASPAHNRELFEAIQHHMERDYSPTYFFRISRAEQLLEMYKEDLAGFRKLYAAYRNRIDPDQRAPHRLSVWLTPDDLSFRTCDDLKKAQGKTLVRPFDDPNFYGFSLRRTGPGAIGEDDMANQEYYLQASPAVVGTITYLAYETRRLHEAMKPRGEKWVPLEITALVQPLEYEERQAQRHGSGKPEPPAHCSGQVFDLNYANLPAGQREALEFVLADMGWDGYLGFVRDSASTSTFHIGAAPTARDFFTKIYDEALERAGGSS
jgi:hypothetical protein